MMFMALAAISSCVDLNWDEKKQENANNSFFAKMVGRIDPDHTWNLSKEGSVTISTASATDVKIYSFDGKSYRLLASKNIDGTEKINFDIFCGINEVLVENQINGDLRKVALGGNASFNGTRTVFGGNDVVSASLSSNYEVYDFAKIQNDVTSSDFEDLDNAVSMFVSKTGSITLSPVWYTTDSGQKQTIGIYYYKIDGTKVDVPIYSNDKFGDDKMMIIGTGSDTEFHDYNAYYDAHMPSLNNRSDFNGKYETRTINVNVPKNTPFGFYILGGRDQATIGYSEADLCIAPSFGYNENSSTFIGKDLAKYGHVAIIGDYLAFDDALENSPHSYTNPEYWHLVFNYSGLEPYKPAGEDPQGKDPQGDDPQGDDPNITPNVEDGAWILACEDVFTGSLNSDSHCDYDFNDVVFSVKHIAGESTATLTFLAAGSTIANYIYFGDIEIGEIHDLLKNSEKDAKGAYTMLNTRINGASAAPQTTTISVPANFSMANNMGGFKIVRKVSNNKSIESITTGAPETGSVPYMICVPADWKWPVENQTITGVYSAFATWCADHESATNWYTSPDESKVFKFPSMVL